MFLKNKLTGKKRHRVQSLGRFRKRNVLVLQYEVEGFVPEYYGGPSVEGGFQKWWVDAMPEWELVEWTRFDGRSTPDPGRADDKG